MDPNIKMISAGLALFILGGISVYLITSQHETSTQPAVLPTQPAPITDAEPLSTTAVDTAANSASAESFYEAAEARREQQLINKEESDRITKLTAIKARSVECKFWKQQQKTSSAAAKIEEKIIQHCTVKTSSSANSESSSSEASSESVSSSS